jgi:hypothetical protein
LIETIGWIALALGGAYLLGALGIFIGTGLGRGGLEAVPRGFAFGAVIAVGWIALVVWWSPLTIGIQ